MVIKKIPLAAVAAFLFICFLGLSACSTVSERFDLSARASATSAVVYIYRPNAMSNMMVAPDVLIDDAKTFAIRNNHYHVLYLPSGKHQIKLDLSERYQGVSQIDLETVAGQNYFLRVSTAVKFQMNQPYDRWFNLERVSLEMAQDEIAQCKPYEQENKPSRIETISQESQESEYSSRKFRNPFSK